MTMCEPLFSCLEVNHGIQRRVGNTDDSVGDSSKISFRWNWLLPAACRVGIEIPRVKATAPYFETTVSDFGDDTETKFSDVLTTITEEEGLDSFSLGQSSLYSMPKNQNHHQQLPPPSFFDMYSLPRAPSMGESPPVTGGYCCGRRLPSPPSLDWD